MSDKEINDIIEDKMSDTSADAGSEASEKKPSAKPTRAKSVEQDGEKKSTPKRKTAKIASADGEEKIITRIKKTQAAQDEALLEFTPTEADAPSYEPAATSDGAVPCIPTLDTNQSAQGGASSEDVSTLTLGDDTASCSAEGTPTDEISAQADESAADNDAEARADGGDDEGDVFEISFFGYESDIQPFTDGEEYQDDTEDADTVDDVDDGQLSFFDTECDGEKDEEPALPPPPAEIPLFIPKKPKSGAVIRQSAYNPDKPRFCDTAFDFIELFIISLVCVLILTSFFFRHSKVVGDSMMNTLHDGEHLIISDAFYTPERGDIVVIEDKSINLSGSEEMHYALVKRVIAIAGDRVVVNSMGEVYLNGERLDEDYVYLDGPVYERRVDLIVPEGEIFVLGDHRNNSTDSRRFGTVKVDCVIGRALIRVYPFEKFGKVE